MKTSAIAHSNIAFIKYWGRSSEHDPELNIPMNDSVSMTKDGLLPDIRLKTHTTIEFCASFAQDSAVVNGDPAEGRGLERIVKIVDPLRRLARINDRFRMLSINDFPTQAGLASSASGFAALAMAAAAALKLELSKEVLSTLVRLGSGSAPRSLYSGFAYSYRGTTHETSFTEQICGPEKLNIRAIIAVIDEEKKKVTSDDGHAFSGTSPFNVIRISESREQAQRIRKAILEDDFSIVGSIAEQNCKLMHAVMITAQPPLYYWDAGTIRVIKKIDALRREGLECYFTIDAGPNIHCLCRPENMEMLKEQLSKTEGVKRIIPVKPGEGARVIQEHLF